MCQRVIIADDHPVFLIGLRAVIESAFQDRFVVSDEATNVDQLLQILDRNQPDILLTDFNMPGREKSDGLRLIETLRRKYPTLSIVVITVLANQGLINTILAKGVYAVINKQSLATDLTQCLKSWLRGHQHKIPVTDEPQIKMSPRELEVLRLLAQGKSINEIAAILKRTKQTISTQKKSAMNKLGTVSTAELLEYLHSAGF
ncbi:DNA-binding response regulator [Enterobacterales bacterium CwR94]|nr:DNA-binding response regulator [Enterobacterales bacterium CwR94]